MESDQKQISPKRLRLWWWDLIDMLITTSFSKPTKPSLIVVHMHIGNKRIHSLPWMKLVQMTSLNSLSSCISRYATCCLRENPGCMFIATNCDAGIHLTESQEWAGTYCPSYFVLDFVMGWSFTWVTSTCVFVYTIFVFSQQVKCMQNGQRLLTSERCRLTQGLALWLVPSKAQQRRNHLWLAGPRPSWWIMLHQSKLPTFELRPSNDSPSKYKSSMFNMV